MVFTKNNHLRSGIHYANARLKVIIFCGDYFYKKIIVPVFNHRIAERSWWAFEMSNICKKKSIFAIVAGR